MQTQPNDWLVQVPLSQLVSLQNMANELDSLRTENKRLQGSITGLHDTLYRTLEMFSDLKKELSCPAGRRA